MKKVMAQQISNSTEQLHELFHQYLMGKLEDAEDVRLIQETAEEVLPYTLNEYFGTGFTTIYDLQDESQIESLRRKIKAHAMLKGIDQRAEPRYTEVLKWYRLFLKSLQVNKSPLLVPGEEDEEEETESPSGFVGVAEQKTVQKTIFVEGETEMQQPKEIRRRNQELREACIDYYKSLHGGRIVCECCGFDFSRAYDIADEYIEVHHRFPFSQTDGEHEVDAHRDLVPLCANCHRMIHHLAEGQGTCIKLEELKLKYKGIKYHS